MVLLKRNDINNKPEVLTDLHSNMVLLKPINSFWVGSVTNSFTFQYGTTKTKKKLQ